MTITKSPAGRLLADIYQTLGSRFGVSRVNDDEVVLVHDLGAEIASERFKWQLISIGATGVAQSSVISASVTIPHDRFRVSHAWVFTDDGESSKIDFCNVNVMASIADGVAGMGSVACPIFTWDSTAGVIVSVNGKFEVSGSNLDYDFLLPQFKHTDLECIGPKSSNYPATESVTLAQLRGKTSAFGAGTLDIFAFICVQHHSEINQATRRIRSRGLPRSW